ncbi:MAG: M48 family metalloprotease [Candidatus Fibromonas sp.]|jgi:predicted Zn-dependent protease|nr:M48 family metalloprotease [Candidatus Fibromonas sp.]
MSNKWKFFWAVSLVSVVFFQACVNSWEELLISLEDEKKMGQEFDALVKTGDPQVMQSGESVFTPKTDEQIALYNYYQERAREIVNAIDPKDLDALLPSGYTKNNFFEFKIINSTQVNAFAVPGGYVYFYTAILKQFKSESELMGVLGHEVGHVVRHHSREGMVKQFGASAVISIFLGDGMAGLIGSLAGQFWLLSNSRENELEADESGYDYTNKIGISSKGLSNFFARGLDTNAQGKCKNPEKESSILDVLSTHPPSCERVEKNLNRILKSGQNLPMDKSDYNGKFFTQLVSEANL